MRSQDRIETSSNPPQAHGTHHPVLTDTLGGLDGPVQAGLANVDVLGVRVAGQQPQQGAQVDVVVIIHMAEPSEGKAKP